MGDTFKIQNIFKQDISGSQVKSLRIRSSQLQNATNGIYTVSIPDITSYIVYSARSSSEVARDHTLVVVNILLETGSRAQFTEVADTGSMSGTGGYRAGLRHALYSNGILSITTWTMMRGGIDSDFDVYVLYW